VNAEDFVAAQDRVWPAVLDELRAGRKTSHWMWFVFPQIAGLGRSPMAQRYALAGADEAREYLAHPVLGPRLREAAELLLTHTGLSAFDIFGGIDALKLRSSMTLFAHATGEPLFQRVLDRYFDGEPDPATLDKGVRPL
jgi:uncharacterized protein (DUF1810 family)